MINWAGVPDSILEEVKRRYPEKINGQLFAGPTTDESQQLIAQQSEGSQLLLVKSWEPPLAELADYLANSHGYLLPLDWKESRLQGIESFHLEEWRRFAAAQNNWDLLALPEVGA